MLSNPSLIIPTLPAARLLTSGLLTIQGPSDVASREVGRRGKEVKMQVASRRRSALPSTLSLPFLASRHRVGVTHSAAEMALHKRHHSGFPQPRPPKCRTSKRLRSPLSRRPPTRRLPSPHLYPAPLELREGRVCHCLSTCLRSTW
jgi:hypothetical protein